MGTQSRIEDVTSGFKHVFELEPEFTALLIIDMQNASACRTEGIGRLIDPGKNRGADWRFTRIERVVIPNLLRLLSFFRQHGLTIVHVAIGSEVDDYSDMPLFLRPLARAAGNRVGQRGNEFLPEVRPLPGERVIRKTTQSAFLSSSIDAVLRAMNKRFLLFTGVSTNACVDGTARDAADLSYSCVIVEDASAGTSEELHSAALESFANQAGLVLSTEQVLHQLSTHLGVSLSGGSSRARQSESFAEGIRS